jgi:hypothetical protein
MMLSCPAPRSQPRLIGGMERQALLTGVGFLEMTAQGPLDIRALTRWFENDVVAPGYMPSPLVIFEAPAGSVSTHPASAALAATNARLPRLVSMAREHVVTALRGFIHASTDDAFLRAAIFLGRVRREEGRWIARPEITAPLSAVVLSLFAVGILSDRTTCEHELCVCDACGRVSFDARPQMRTLCLRHTVQTSGVMPAFGEQKRAG